MRLQNKVVIVTGSTTGIGKAIAFRCISEGAKVVIHGLEADLGKAVMSGQGTVTSHDATNGKTSSMEFSFRTVYDYVSSSPRQDSATGSGSYNPSTGPTVKVEYSIKF